MFAEKFQMSVGALGKTVGTVRRTKSQGAKFGNFDKRGREKRVEVTENIVTNRQ